MASASDLRTGFQIFLLISPLIFWALHTGVIKVALRITDGRFLRQQGFNSQPHPSPYPLETTKQTLKW